MIRYDNPDLYIAYLYEEQDILSNVLEALAKFRRATDYNIWPRQVVVRRNNRIPFDCLKTIEVIRNDKNLMDAMYMSLFSPLIIPDIPKRRARRKPKNLVRISCPGLRTRRDRYA